MRLGILHKIRLRYLIVSTWLFCSLLFAGISDCSCGQKRTSASSCCEQHAGCSTGSAGACCYSKARIPDASGRRYSDYICNCAWCSAPYTCLGCRRTDQIPLPGRADAEGKGFWGHNACQTAFVACTAPPPVPVRAITAVNPSSQTGPSLNVLLCVFLC